VQDLSLTTILRRGWWIVLLTVAAAVALAVLLTARADRVYQATAVVQVTSVATPGPAGTDPLRAQEASRGLATQYATLIDERSFVEQIRPQVAGGELTTRDLLDRVDATAVEDTGLIRLRVEGPSPEEARSLASDVAEAFVGFIQQTAVARSQQQQQALEQRIAEISTQIEELRAEAAGDPETAEQLETLRAAREALATQLATVVAHGIEQGGSVALSAPPTASPAPIRPQPMLNLAAALMLGLIAGTGLAFLRLRLDRGLHSAAEAEQLIGAPVLASIPVRRRFSPEDAVLGEAYDVLRANLAFISLDRPLEVLTFSSYNPREGKSSSVEGLAYAAVRGGMNVAVVDGDVRTRTLSGRLGHADAPGLTSAIVGMANLEDVLVEIAPGLSLLPSGPTPPNPPSLLSSDRMRELVESLREQFQLVIIDSPPVANLADAAILAAVSDGVVVVTRVGLTERAHLPAAAANLRHSPTPIVGAVVLEPRTVDQTYYPAMAKGRPAVPDTAVPS